MAEFAVAGTEALVWYATGEHQRLGRPGLRLFTRADEGLASIYLPTIVLAEFSDCLRAGAISLGHGYAAWEEALFASGHFFPVGLTREIVRRADRLHGVADRRDRLLVATALHLGCPLITPEPEQFAATGVVAVW